MARLTTEAVLMQYADTMIRDLGKVDGRKCLLANVPLWREHYGEAVTKRVIAHIRAKLGEG